MYADFYYTQHVVKSLNDTFNPQSTRLQLRNKHKLLEISLFQMFHVTFQNAIVIVIWYRIDPIFLEIRPLHSTVKHVLNDHSKIDKAKILITIGSLMTVESIPAFCNTFDLH